MTTARRVAGVDPSLSSTGVALPDGTFATIAPPSSVTGYRRHRYVAHHLDVMLYEREVDLVVIEDYARHGKGIDSLIRGAELQGLIRTDLAERAIPFATIYPNTLKLYAVGKGNAKKGEVFDAARAAVAATVTTSALVDPDYADIANYDEADAYFLRAFGVAILAGTVAFPERGVDWPEEVGRP